MGRGLAQRGLGRCQDIVDLNADNCVEKLSVEDWNILFEFDEEYHRRGDFERIFPNKANVDKYLDLFQTQRYSNYLIRQWLHCPENFLERICKKVSDVEV